MEVARQSLPDRFHTTVWQAPLVPAALAATAGAIVDRHAAVPLKFSAVLFVVGLAAWAVTRRSARHGLPLVYLGIVCVAFGAGYHHFQRNWYPADGIGNFAANEPRLARIRGIVVEDSRIRVAPENDPLRSYAGVNRTTTTIVATELKQPDGWASVSGRLRLTLAGPCLKLSAGDTIEVAGMLSQPEPSSNPGELDYAAVLHDERIRAVMQSDASPTFTIVTGRQMRSWDSLLGSTRGWGKRVLSESLPPQTANLAIALLLGDGSALTETEWDKYRRTGVMHVLVVSGQHLVVLSAFLWFVLRLAMVPRRRAALVITVLLFGYAALTGGRPPVIRAVVMVSVFCGAILFVRIPLPVNTFALAWLVVFAIDPTDIFGLGCQLSFLSVAVLYWCFSIVQRRKLDPLEKLIEEARSAWEKWLRWAFREVGLAYLVTLAVGLAVAPLTASQYHLVSWTAFVLGPQVVLLASIGLIGGFLLLLAAAIQFPAVALFAWVTNWSLAGCDALVDLGDRFRHGHWYVSRISEAWLSVLYCGIISFLFLPSLQRQWQWLAAALLIWLGVGLAGDYRSESPEGLRCTFLAVGHGGCTVIETPDGRVLLYDAGAMTGPEVTQRNIAPFLWSRGIRRLDEVFISHADLDHFNGISALLERFAVAQITCTPTFANKSAPGVKETLDAIRRHDVPMRIAKVGDRLHAGEVVIDVLHPPSFGPDGRENFRSMVLHVQYAGKGMLLTGDVEGPGLEQLVNQPLPRTEVLMAPHHGSRAGDSRERQNRDTLVRLTQPNVIIASKSRTHGTLPPGDPYSANGIRYLGTGSHGAVTVHFRADELSVETYRTQERHVVSRAYNTVKNQ